MDGRLPACAEACWRAALSSEEVQFPIRVWICCIGGCQHLEDQHNTVEMLVWRRQVRERSAA